MEDKEFIFVQIYCTDMMSFSLSNSTEELGFASLFYAQFENRMTSDSCNIYEQITPSYP